MKVLTIKTDGTFSAKLNELEVLSDVADPNLSQADAQLMQDEIDNLQAQSMQEIHLEKGPINTFVHKVGSDVFAEESDPDAYNIFQTLDQWIHDISVF